MELGTKLCLSGLESRRLLETFADFAVPHIQVSYYYLRRVFPDPQEFEQYSAPFSTVIIDHGLIYHKYKSEVEKKEFLEDYAGYIGGLNKGVYNAVVSHPDIPLDRYIDTSKLIYPLDDLEELFEGDMKAVFSQVEYIGISNKTAKDEERMGFLSSQASKKGVKLHVFGTSSIKVLKKWPIYSANSSSWRTGSRYANTYIYEGQTRGLRIYQPTDKADLDKTDREKRVIRTRLKHMVESRQPPLYKKIDWEALIEEDDSWQVDNANLSQWILYQQDLELETKGRYWLEQSDIEALNTKRQDLLSTFNTQASSGVGEERDSVAGILPREKEDEIIAPPPIEGEVLEGDLLPANIENVEMAFPTNKRLTEVDPRLTTPRKCDFCILANRCPKYEQGANCYFGLSESYSPINIDGHIDEDVADLLAMQKDRILQGYLEEKADSSGLNKDLNREIRTYLELIALYKQAKDTRDTVEFKAKGTGLMQMFNKKNS